MHPGGTKARVLGCLLDNEHDEYVYASPAQGYAQLALAHVCAKRGKKATVFVAKRAVRHRITIEAAKLGAKIIEVPAPAFLSVVSKRANDYATQHRAKLLPFGIRDPRIIAGISDVARRLTKHIPVPKEVWCVASSGTLLAGLREAWPNAEFNAVRIGAKRDLGDVTAIWEAPEKFEQDARQPPPFASCANYDAKAWQFIKRYASAGALFWNVGA
jgi:threonine dehydratase